MPELECSLASIRLPFPMDSQLTGEGDDDGQACGFQAVRRLRLDRVVEVTGRSGRSQRRPGRHAVGPARGRRRSAMATVTRVRRVGTAGADGRPPAVALAAFGPARALLFPGRSRLPG